MNKEQKEMWAAILGVAPEEINDNGTIKHDPSRIAKKITMALDEAEKEQTNE